MLDLEGNLTIKPLGQPPRDHPYRHEQCGFASNCVLATQQHFVDQMFGARQFETTGEDYLKTLAVQEAIYESAEKKARVIVSVM